MHNAGLKDKINYQLMGANKWQNSPSIEKMSNHMLTLYLTNTENDDFHLLSPDKAATADFLEQRVDFEDRNTWNNNSYPDPIIREETGVTGYYFLSEPFKEPVQVNGSFTGELQVSSVWSEIDEFSQMNRFWRIVLFFSLGDD